MKDEQKKKLSKKEINGKKHQHWVIWVTVGTFLSTIVITYISDTLLTHTNLVFSLILLLVIIALGIFTDIIGIAVASVTIDPFNAMAAKKIKGAKTAVNLVKNAPRVSNVCNDVIGDICGIVSGAIVVNIAAQLVAHYPLLNASILSLASSAAVACLTVGGKAFGKDIAMQNGTAIVHGIAVPVATVKMMFKGQE